VERVANAIAGADVVVVDEWCRAVGERNQVGNLRQ